MNCQTLFSQKNNKMNFKMMSAESMKIDVHACNFNPKKIMTFFFNIIEPFSVPELIGSLESI